MPLQLGDLAPDFSAVTTEGPIEFYSWKGGRWAVLFSHPKDFTPVCTTELGAVAALRDEFEARDTCVIGLSVDSVESHRLWSQDITDVTGQRVNFPLIADPERKVAQLYEMVHPNASDTMTVRSVFILDPGHRIRLMLTYPASTGRNFREILRALDSLQLTAKHSVATPADWRQGEDVIITTAVSDADAAKRFPGFTAVKPYLRVTPAPRS
jgi:alkyl hydroperoxide reductase subunit AhpC